MAAETGEVINHDVIKVVISNDIIKKPVKQ